MRIEGAHRHISPSMFLSARPSGRPVTATAMPVTLAGENDGPVATCTVTASHARAPMAIAGQPGVSRKATALLRPPMCAGSYRHPDNCYGKGGSLEHGEDSFHAFPNHCFTFSLNRYHRMISGMMSPKNVPNRPPIVCPAIHQL